MSRHFFTLNGSTLTSGGAKNLAKGQFTIVKLDSASATSNGAAVVGTGDFASLSPSQKLGMRLGKASIPQNRTTKNSNPYASETFSLSSIVDIKKYMPKFQKRVFDEIVIGYDGLNESTAIKLEDGQHTVLDILLKGEPISFYTGSCSFPIKFHFGKEVGETDQDTIKRAVKSLKDMPLVHGITMNDVAEVSVVDSSNLVLSGIPYTFQTLTVTDTGDSNALGAVQAQYPTHKVYLTDRDGLKSTYSVLAPSGTSLSAFTQTTIVVTDADCDGDPETSATTVSTSWVAGQTCYATVESYKIQLADSECGESRLSELEASYPNLTIEEGAPTGMASRSVTLTGTSGTANITIGGVDYLATFATDLTTTASNFVTAHADAIETATGLEVTSALGVLTLTGSAKGFASVSRTNVSGNLSATIASVDYEVSAEVGGCQRVYSTQVLTNIVCDECDPAFLGQFESEKPNDFDFNSWELVQLASDEDALMGIKIKGKPFDIVPTEAMKDQLRFYETSTRVEAAGGYIMEVNESFADQYTENFVVTRLKRAQDRDNLGAHLLGWEEASMAYFDGSVRHKDNLYAKQVLGEESVLDFRKQYVQYAITIHDSKYSQGVGRSSDMGTTYNVWAELGKETALDTYIDALATELGISL